LAVESPKEAGVVDWQLGVNPTTSPAIESSATPDACSTLWMRAISCLRLAVAFSRSDSAQRIVRM